MNQKKVLVVFYSQSGQLTRVVDSFIAPLFKESFIEVTTRVIKPIFPYPFPWDLMTFMDTFPESVHLDGCQIEAFEDDNEYDVIILAYQVWFLSPCIPITGFLKTSYAKKKFINKPVITLIGCRNMWVMAQEKMKNLLNEMGAHLIDNVVLIDQGSSLETFITTPRWMLTGRTNSIFGLSEAGISDKEIKHSSRFGKALIQALRNDDEKKRGSLLQGLKAVCVDMKLLNSEKIATKSFMIWGTLIKKLGKPGALQRKPVVMLYLVFLLLMIITVVPLNMMIQAILRLTKKESVDKQKDFYELPSGSKDDRIKEFL